jgi:Cu(I)/Ag(I) efflux system protein CusF
MLRRTMLMGVAALAGALASMAWAQSTGHAGHSPAPASPVPSMGAPAPMTEGEVRKVDKGAGKVTLKHGPIPNLDMPDMTMVFRVKEPAMLDQVKVGDKVRFAADKVGGQYTVVRIEPAK